MKRMTAGRLMVLGLFAALCGLPGCTPTVSNTGPFLEEMGGLVSATGSAYHSASGSTTGSAGTSGKTSTSSSSGTSGSKTQKGSQGTYVLGAEDDPFGSDAPDADSSTKSPAATGGTTSAGKSSTVASPKGNGYPLTGQFLAGLFQNPNATAQGGAAAGSGGSKDPSKMSKAELEALGKKTVQDIDNLYAAHLAWVKQTIADLPDTRGSPSAIAAWQAKIQADFGIPVQGASGTAYGFSVDELQLLHGLLQALPPGFRSAISGIRAKIDATPLTTIGIFPKDGSSVLEGITSGHEAIEGTVNSGSPSVVNLTHSASTSQNPREGFLKTAIHEMAHAYSFVHQTGGKTMAEGEWPVMQEWMKAFGWTFDPARRPRYQRDPATEPPVRDYGTGNAKEDFATAVEMYLADPAGMAKRFPKRYAWVRNNVMGGASLPSLAQLSHE